MKLLAIVAAAGLGLCAALPSGSANAAVLSIINGPSDVTVTCPSGCYGLVGNPASFSATSADAYDFGAASEASLASNLSTLTGVFFDASDVSKTDGGSRDFSFTADAGFFFFKYGSFTSFFLTDTAQEVSFLKTGGGPAAVSNYGTIGTTVSPVPVPAAGLLLLGALGGFAALRRRKAV